MNIKLLFGIWLALIFCYLLAKHFLKPNPAVLAYRRMMRDLMTNEKYQVKGKFG
jgi:hypothetical protein